MKAIRRSHFLRGVVEKNPIRRGIDKALIILEV